MILLDAQNTRMETANISQTIEVIPQTSPSGFFVPSCFLARDTSQNTRPPSGGNMRGSFYRLRVIPVTFSGSQTQLKTIEHHEGNNPALTRGRTCRAVRICRASPLHSRRASLARPGQQDVLNEWSRGLSLLSRRLAGTFRSERPIRLGRRTPRTGTPNQGGVA